MRSMQNFSKIPRTGSHTLKQSHVQLRRRIFLQILQKYHKIFAVTPVQNKMAEAVRPEKKKKKAKKIDKASPKIQRQSPSTKWFVEDTEQEVEGGKSQAFVLFLHS